MLVYDHNDLWAVDPVGKSESVCITAGEGRKRDLRLRLIDTDPDQRYISKNDRLLFSLFNYSDLPPLYIAVRLWLLKLISLTVISSHRSGKLRMPMYIAGIRQISAPLRMYMSLLILKKVSQ